MLPMLPTLPPRAEEDRGPLSPGVEPHRAGRLLALGVVGLFLFPIAFYVLFWAKDDLTRMDRGHLDPAGRGQTIAALACAGFIVLTCCVVVVTAPFALLGMRCPG